MGGLFYIALQDASTQHEPEDGYNEYEDVKITTRFTFRKGSKAQADKRNGKGDPIDNTNEGNESCQSNDKGYDAE